MQIQFNSSKQKGDLTWDEIFVPLTEITSVENAQQYLNDYAQYIAENNTDMSRERAKEIALSNIKYNAGQLSKEEQRNISKVFQKTVGPLT